MDSLTIISVNVLQVDQACNQMSVIGRMYCTSVSFTKENVCVKVLAWVSLPSEPEVIIAKNIATDCASQEENANELLLIVLAKKTVWANYNWLC